METELGQDLAAALVQAQSEFPTIPKNKTADAGKYSYKYADLPDILDAIRPVLKKHGLAVIQAPDGDVLVTVIIHESGQSISGRIPLPTGKSPQELGSWLTYLRRYSLTAMLGIAADEDDDAGSAQAAHAARKAPPKATTSGSTVEQAQGVLGGTLVEPDAQAAFEDSMHNLFDVGVGSLTGHVENPRKEMRLRLGLLLKNIGRDRVSEITNRDEQTALYRAMRDVVDELERNGEPS
jgi:hypothetical protein